MHMDVDEVEGGAGNVVSVASETEIAAQWIGGAAARDYSEGSRGAHLVPRSSLLSLSRTEKAPIHTSPSSSTTISPSSHWSASWKRARKGAQDSPSPSPPASISPSAPSLLARHSFTRPLLFSEAQAPDPIDNGVHSLETYRPLDSEYIPQRRTSSVASLPARRPPSALSIRSSNFVPSSLSSARAAPYRIPLPLSSTRSTMEQENDDAIDSEQGYSAERTDRQEVPSTPTQAAATPLNPSSSHQTPMTPATPRTPRSPSSTTSSSAFPSPSGSMSLSQSRSRKPPPSFPSSPRQPTERPISAGHLRLIYNGHVTVKSPRSPPVRSPGNFPISASAPLQTPALLRVPSAPGYSPAFNRSGYAYPHPRRGSHNSSMMINGTARSPHSPYFHRGSPATSPLPGMPMSASAPVQPKPRTPGLMGPPGTRSTAT